LDIEQFKKSLTYVMAYLMHSMKSKGRIILTSQRVQLRSGEEGIHITLRGIGCKLSIEELQQLFDPFCMEQSTLIDVGPCVAQKIVEEHGGHLDVRQEKNGDTTFVVTLPVSR